MGLLWLALSATSSAGGLERTTRVSRNSGGAEGDRRSVDPQVSGDGRFVVFRSDATGLVPGDTNDETDVFVRDRQLGLTRRLSVSATGVQADAESFLGDISADGRVIAFSSMASNLVPSDTNHVEDIFLAERTSQRIVRLMTDAVGVESDGRSYEPRLAADRQRVVFTSGATNLVLDDSNGKDDVFVKDIHNNVTMRVSVGTNGEQGNGISFGGALSFDGRYVVFASVASNLVADDRNMCCDVFLHDCSNGETRRLSVNALGQEGDQSSLQPSITPDGQYVVFQSLATNLVDHDTNGTHDIFVSAVASSAIVRVSVDSLGLEGNGKCGLPSISHDGRYVVFASNADNLVPLDTNDARDIFLHDMVTAQTSRASIDSLLNQANDGSNHPAISGDGRTIVFSSLASNLVEDDLNGFTDVFVRAPAIADETQPIIVSQGPPEVFTDGAVGDGWRWMLPRISAVPLARRLR